jgi:glucokinase
MQAPAQPRLLADIGGTHARFAWQAGAGAPLTDEVVLPCDDHSSLEAAIGHYLARRGGHRPMEAALAMANPVQGDQVHMTNRDWSFSVEALKHSMGLRRLVVLNDFKALALALPALQANELLPLHPGTADPHAPRAVLGPGTGLGVATLVSTPQGDVALEGEGGHVTLAAADEEEAAVLAWLRQRFGHASAERALSGPGLVNLYQAACGLSGQTVASLTPADVVDAARSGTDPACTKALGWFMAFLGNVAGNLALTVGARRGVYIGGGIPPRIADLLPASRFSERFLGKGRFRGYLSSIPVHLIDARSSAALRGATRALDAAT